MPYVVPQSADPVHDSIAHRRSVAARNLRAHDWVTSALRAHLSGDHELATQCMRIAHNPPT